MAGERRENEISKNDVFIEGHFRDRYERGERPDFSEPRSPLPKVRPGFTMEVVPSFIASRRRGKT